MAFIDEIQFHAKAGNGGNGVVRWRHEKNKEYSGAAGGNGGPGGDVYVKAVRDMNILARHQTTKLFKARNGDEGQNWSRQGKAGEDFVIDLPIGSITINLSSGRRVELLEEGQTEKILHGGRGGLGNEHFKASTNVRPEESTEGVKGEEADFTVELNLIADIGLIGLPNAGKSSLLNALTHARAKVANYAFTTLEPNLGVLPGGYIVADIPGLIEGASEGKGLGHKFLKHVTRTKILLHLVPLGSDDADNLVTPNVSGKGSASSKKTKIKSPDLGSKEIERMYSTVRKELEKYGSGLMEKKEIVVLTKTDLVDEKAIKNARKILSKYNKNILEVTVLDDDFVKKLIDEVGAILNTSTSKG